ncbi:hypothetical protein [Pedobacter sp. UYP30]|uniref:hypothetical protein n=1 Tax=Pedobacter sp. UYP30 TaxID=1756400 RepID=UPI0033926DD8
MKIHFKHVSKLTPIFVVLTLTGSCKKDQFPVVPPAGGDVTILHPDTVATVPVIRDSIKKDSLNIGKQPDTAKNNPFDPPVVVKPPATSPTGKPSPPTKPVTPPTKPVTPPAKPVPPPTKPVTPPLPPMTTPPPPVTPPTSGIDMVGTGSGALILNGLTNKKLTIKPGTYTYFEFKNFKNVTVDGSHNVKIVGGGVHLTNMSGVTLMNFDILNSPYRAVDVYDVANDLILKNLTMTNIGDVCMVFHADKPYNGQPSSYSNNIQLLNIVADNISTFFGGNGSVTNNGFTGLIKNFKMSSCTIKNSPGLSDGVFLGCAEDYEISNNRINNVNSKQGNHNGIFHLQGNGKIFNNTCTNHQGNMVRAWMCSITKPGSVEIYNNVVWNSTRYGAFELQVPPSLKATRAFKPGITAKVYNNTVGQLNTGMPKYFEGRLLDLYDVYTSVQVYNNLLFNNRDNKILNQMSSAGLTTLIKNSNNVYKANASDAVADLRTFRSLIPGVGASR